MIKRQKTLVILLLLAVLSIGLYAVTAYGLQPGKGGHLFSLKAEEITEIRLENEYGSYAFYPGDKEWKVKTSQEYRTNKKKMDIMLKDLENLTYSRILEEDNGQYGLDKPAVNAEISVKDGESFCFSVGHTTASQSDVYLRDDSDGQIYVVSLDKVVQLNGSLGAYRDNEIFTVDLSKLSAMEYFRKKEQTLTLAAGEDGYWIMKKPYEAPARNVIMKEILGMLDSWMIADYLQLNPEEYARAGLDEPEHELVLSDTDGNTQRIAFGKEMGSRIAVQTGDSNEVVALFTADVDFGEFNGDTLVYVAPLRAGLEEVEAVTVKGEHSYEFLVDASAQTASLNQRMIDFNDFTGIYYKYVLMIAQGGEKTPVTMGGEPLYTLTTSLKNGSSLELELYQRDQDTYYMGRDGQAQFYMEKSRLDDLLVRVEACVP